MSMSETLNTQTTYVSVTIDFLKALNPDWDIENDNRHLFAALRAVGINPEKKIDVLKDKFVRYVHAPLYSRETTIYQGQLIKGYQFADMYNNIEVLDVNIKNDVNIETVVKFLTEMDKKKKLVQDFDFEDESCYVGSEGNRDLKNNYMTKQDKKKYKVINVNDETLDKILEKKEIYSSPFDLPEEDNGYES